MLSINASLLRASQTEASPAAHSGSDPTPPNGDPAGFASLLRQTQVAGNALPAGAGLDAVRGAVHLAPENSTIHSDASDVPHNEAAPSKPEENQAASDANPSTTSTDGPANAQATAQTRALARARLRGADSGTAHDSKSAVKTKATTDAAHDAATPDATPAPSTGAIDPNVMQWLASQQRPAVAEAVPKIGGESDMANPTTTTAATTDNLAALAGGIGNKHMLTPAELKAEAALKGQTSDDSGQRFAATLDTATTQAAAGDKSLADAIAGAAASPKFNAETMAAAAAAQLANAKNEITAAAAPTSVAIATPVEAPEFGHALGMQLSVLARDGVQQAELHLNPSDMGPVSVQIVMDGTQARIDFGADVAATRQAIEAGLPALASALRDAGFTLAGGGVSQQSQQSQQRSDGSGGDARRDARGSRDSGADRGIDAAARAAATPRRVTLGAVDTYA